MNKLLIVAPHLSTGGMPQYLLKYIEENKNNYDEIKLVEFSIFSTAYIIQKKKIIDIIGEENLITLGNFSDRDIDYNYFLKKRKKLIDIIKDFDPDIVYMSESPEGYEYITPPDEIMREVYKSDRKYKIIETIHNNAFDFAKKKYIPDEFMFCSNLHIEQSQHINIPKVVWEYPMTSRERPDRSKILIELGLDPTCLHVLNVGLVCENKNQKYIFDLSKKFKNKKACFHFIGNDCFLNSSGITQEDIGQENCKMWGERSDVDKFMSCMDVYLFPSKKELNPLTIKEALSWGMVVIANDDKSYTDQYSDFSNFYLMGDINVEELIDRKILSVCSISHIEDSSQNDRKFLIVCSFYNNTKENILQTFNNVIKQTYGNWLLVVGDDFSDDGCRDILKEEVKKINHSNILYYDVKFKRELYLYQNFFKSISYDYYFDLDSDDVLDENLLEVYNEYFKKYSNVFSIFCDYDVVSEDGRLERISVVRNSSGKDYIDEFHERTKSSYIGIWEKYYSWNMYGHARCFRKSDRSKFPISKSCRSSTDSFVLFSCLSEGDHLHIPRNMYKLVNRDKSDSSSMSQKEIESYNDNALLAINKYEENRHYNALPVFDDIWFETNALSCSDIVKNSEDINLISDINNEQLLKIKKLYRDKHIILNSAAKGNVVIVWNKLTDDQKSAAMSIIMDKRHSFTIYNCLDNFDVPENKMEEYFKKESKSFFDFINNYIRDYSYFNYFRHIVINGKG